MADLHYDLTSLAGPVDWNVVRWLEQHRHLLDHVYVEHAKQFHGGIPGRQFFDMQGGRTLRVGRFLTLVDERSSLEPPFRRSWQFPERDIRIDWSVLTLIDQEGPSCRHLFAGEELVPFAVLYRGEHHPDHWSLTEAGCDLLCFDYRAGGRRPRVVVWHAERAAEEYRRWDQADGDEVRYGDFTEAVAEDFDEFLKLLRDRP